MFTVAERSPNCEALKVAPVPPPKADGVSNCAWLKRLKNSARKSNPIFSHGSAKRLMTEKSVFTKPGPDIGAREVVPNSPVGGATKAQGLKKYPEDFPKVLGALHFGFAATVPGANGLPTSSTRPAGEAVPILYRFAPEVGAVSMTKMGKPEVTFWITVSYQFPSSAFVALFQLLPYFLPRPNGKS